MINDPIFKLIKAIFLGTAIGVLGFLLAAGELLALDQTLFIVVVTSACLGILVSQDKL